MSGPHSPEPSTLQERAEAAFNDYLEGCREGRAPEASAFLAEQPIDLREELGRMLADYRVLRSTIGEGTVGFAAGRDFGDFRLVRELGRGGMGVVWEAEQLSLGRRVALKLLYPHWSLSPNLLDRFQREAEAGGRLTHEGIVRVHSVGECDSTHYIAQELVPGGLTLADSLDDLRSHDALPKGYYRSVAALFVKIADALQAAHAAGVVHRDVKPGNILIAEDDTPKVADFGLAKVADALTLSRTGELTGTPFYMSPEQAASKRIGIDHRTDVFSLGATLYEALTLRRPFAGESTQQVMERILLDEPVDPRKLRPDVPRDLGVICLEALAKRRERRYASMAAMRDDLQRFLDGRPIVARPPGPVDRASLLVRRHPIATTAAAAILVGLGIGVLLTRDGVERSVPSGPSSEATAAPRGTVVRQVWADAEDVLGGPTPDGSSLTFTDWDAFGNLALRDVATGESRLLTDWGAGEGFAEFSIVSPDGELVAYSKCTEFRYDLRVVGLDGSDPRRVYEGDETLWMRPTAWSPDSRSLLAYVAWADHGRGIVLVPIDGGEARTVLRTEGSQDGSEGLSDTGIVFSSDGSHVAYARPVGPDDPRCDVFVRSLATDEERPLVSHPADDRLLGWSPDGGHVLFASDRRGSWSAWTVPVAGVRAVGAPALVELLPADVNGSGFLPIGFTPDGSFYYARRVDLTDVHVAPFDAVAGKATGPAVPVAPDLSGRNGGATWSPDGERLAFVSRDGAHRIVVATDDGELHQVEVPAEAGFVPGRHLRFAPDGERFAAVVRNDPLTEGAWRIALVDAQTGAFELATDEMPGVAQVLPEWSPDGRTIYYLRQVAESDLQGGLYALDLESGRSRCVHPTEMAIGNLALSPDGRWIAFGENRPSGYEDRAVRVVSVEGGEPRDLAVSGEQGTFPLWTPLAWAPDGRSLFYGRSDPDEGEGPIELLRIPFEGGEPVSTGLRMPWMRHARIRPDGSRIAVQAGERRRGVWVIEDFLPPSAAAPEQGTFNRRILSAADTELNNLYDMRPSPDGERVAYGRMGSDGAIFVRDLATGAETQVTSGEFTYTDGPIWSPDGTRLAYRVHPEGILKIVAIATAESHVPAGAGGADLTPLDWSPDGRRVLCERQVDAETTALAALTLATGELETLVPDGLGRSPTAVWSPDGRFVAYSALVDGDRELFLLGTDGGPRRLTEAPGEDGRPLWSPAGDLLVYQHRDDLWGIDFTPAGPAGAPRFLRSGSLGETLEWVAGRGIYTRQHDHSSTFYEVALRPDGALAGPTREALDRPVEQALRHASSPDGAYVLYSTYLDDDVHVWSTRDGSLRTFATGSERRPTNVWWSPSGDRAYIVVLVEEARTVLALDPRSGEIEPLFPPVTGVERFHLHPDGESMLFYRHHEHRDDGRRELVVAPIGSLEGRVVAAETELGAFSNWVRPAFSPEGDRILFGTMEGDLWLASADGSEKRLLASPPETVFEGRTAKYLHSAVWHPSGERVYFDNWRNLFVVDVETGERRELPLEKAGFDDIDGLWQVTGDAGRLQFTGTSGAGPELWLVRDLSWAR